MRTVSIEQYLSEMKAKNKRRYDYTISTGAGPSGLILTVMSTEPALGQQQQQQQQQSKVAFTGQLTKEPGGNIDLYSITFTKAETKVLVEFFM